MVKIIGISGRKQSGKNTSANYIVGDILKRKSMIYESSINRSGQLEIKTQNSDGEIGWGVLDVLRKDNEFTSYAEVGIWPYVKIYHFADYLKRMCVDLFDLTADQVYGSDEDKNTDTPYGMTAREFLQYLGTDVMRNIKDTIWVDVTIKTILSEQSEVAIIPDVRFPNEVEAIHKAGGSVIRLTRDTFNSNHHCEKSLDSDAFNWDNFDYVIDNNNSEISELCNKLGTINKLWRAE